MLNDYYWADELVSLTQSGLIVKDFAYTVAIANLKNITYF